MGRRSNRVSPFRLAARHAALVRWCALSVPEQTQYPVRQWPRRDSDRQIGCIGKWHNETGLYVRMIQLCQSRHFCDAFNIHEAYR